MHALRMVTHKAMTDETLTHEASVEASYVRCCCSLLMPAWLNLVLAKQNSFAMDLLESNVCRGHIVVINGVLI